MYYIILYIYCIILYHMYIYAYILTMYMCKHWESPKNITTFLIDP